MRAEIQITLRGRSASPTTTTRNSNRDLFYSSYYESDRASEIAPTTTVAASRRHSFTTTASQYVPPISRVQLEDARQTIGRRPTARGEHTDSVVMAVVATCAHDLETPPPPPAAKRLPPVHPGSVWLRAPPPPLPLPPAAASTTIASTALNRNTEGSARRSRPLSGNFSSTYLINKPGQICITRSESFKTLRRCDSFSSLNSPSRSCSPHLGFCNPEANSLETSVIEETNLRTTTSTASLALVVDAGRLYVHIPTPKPPPTTPQPPPRGSIEHEYKEPPKPRLRSVASVDSFTCVNPNAKLPPLRPQPLNGEQRNGMLGNNYNKKPVIAAKRQPEFTSTPSLERSAVQITMTGGGNEESTTESGASANHPVGKRSNLRNTPTSPASALPSAAFVGRHYSRVQLPCTRASSRAVNNNHVMTDSLKLYEEQIFSHQILSGQRPLSWCIDTAFMDTGRTTPVGADVANHDNSNSSSSPSSSTVSSNFSSSSSSYCSNASNHAPQPLPPPRIGQRINRLALLQSGAARFSRSTDQSGLSPDPKNRNNSPIIHAARPDSPRLSANAPPPMPPNSRPLPSRGRPQGVPPSHVTTRAKNGRSSSVKDDATTPNADEANKGFLGATEPSSIATSLASSVGLSTVRPARPSSPPPPPPPSTPPRQDEVDEKEDEETPSTTSLDHEDDDDDDDSFPTPSMSLLPPPLPWKDSSTSSISNQQRLFVCPYCRALSTLCRCSASLSNSYSNNYNEDDVSERRSWSTEEDTERRIESDSEDEEVSTYAFSTLDSDFIAWMRLSVRDVTVNQPHRVGGGQSILASLTRDELARTVSVFNTNPLGLQMSLAEGTSKLIGTIRVYINLIKPVKMSLRQTMRHMPQPAPNSSAPDNGAVPDRLISFFLPRGGSRLLQLSGSTSAQEVINCLLDRFHIQESASKFALYEHTLKTETIFSRKLLPSERPLSMVMYWVRDAIAAGEDFAVAIRRKRIVLQENDNWEVNWSEFTPAELTNFLRILEKEEAEYRNAIYFQYGYVRQRVEQRMAQISAHDRLMAARHSVATCPPPLELLEHPSQPSSHQHSAGSCSASFTANPAPHTASL